MLEQVLMTGIIRQGTGLDIQPSRATSVYEYNDKINEYLGIRGKKSDRNVLSFSLKDVNEPFLTKNNTMWSYLEPELTKRLEELNVDQSFSAKVRTALFEQIPAGCSSINEIARILAVSPRTLQRKLKDEETTFIQQLNHTRELMARNYLKDRHISNDEIAFLIGYSDANAFSRAFRGWTGQTIGEYRKLMC
jgi:AraC-like DNA-binding protein